jgi:hypothetical protein
VTSVGSALGCLVKDFQAGCSAFSISQYDSSLGILGLSPPGRDEYFLVNLGSMSAQESTHRALCIIKTSFCALLVKVFFLLWSKVLIPAGRTVCLFFLCVNSSESESTKPASTLARTHTSG